MQLRIDPLRVDDVGLLQVPVLLKRDGRESGCEMFGPVAVISNHLHDNCSAPEAARRARLLEGPSVGQIERSSA